mgnify:CR=1 FL=1
MATKTLPTNIKSASKKRQKSLIKAKGNRGLTDEMVAYLNEQLKKGLDFDDALGEVEKKFGHAGDL